MQRMQSNGSAKCGQRRNGRAGRAGGLSGPVRPSRTIGRNAQNRCGGPVNKKSNQALRGLVLALAGVGAQMNAGNALAAEASKPSAAEERAGIVKSVRGDVQLLSGSAKARAAMAGDAMAPIDRLQTGADSGASVVLRDGTTL